MPCSNPNSLSSQWRFVLAVLFAVAIVIFANCHLGHAETPPSSKAAAASEFSARTTVLSEEDWNKAPRQPVAARRVDELIAAELRLQNGDVPSAAVTTDEQFICRLSLDLTGQLPAPEQIAAFVADSDKEKRRKLIDNFLLSDAYARHWARFWRDVVTARITNRRSMGLTRSFEEWLFERFRAGDSWKQITREILTAQGELRFTLNTPRADNGALFFLVAHDGEEDEERAAETSRVFLGIQIQCAQCHDHPTESWKREQFHNFAAYFARIKFDQLFDDKKLSGVQLVVLPDREHKLVNLKNPSDASVVHPHFLNGQASEKNLSDRDRRQALADAVVDDGNIWFAAAFVNRIWCALMGRSFYRNVDDLGPKKEVIFPELLVAMTKGFQASQYDIRELFRTILNSEAYQRQIHPESSSASLFTAAAASRLRADTLWDSLVHVFGKIEHGARFHTGGGVRFNTSFLEGKFRVEFDFDPSLDQEEIDGTIPQALFLMNNATLNKHIQVTKTNVLGKLLRDYPEDSQAVRQLYLTVLARNPTEREATRCLKHITGTESRPEAFEDLLWALINSTEFQRKR